METTGIQITMDYSRYLNLKDLITNTKKELDDYKRSLLYGDNIVMKLSEIQDLNRKIYLYDSLRDTYYNELYRLEHKVKNINYGIKNINDHIIFKTKKYKGLYSIILNNSIECLKLILYNELHKYTSYEDNRIQ